jgi:hypothetical protein
MAEDMLIARASKVRDPAKETMACRRCFLPIDSMSATINLYRFLRVHTLPEVYHGMFVERINGVVFCVEARSHRQGRQQVLDMVPKSTQGLIWRRAHHERCPSVKKCLVQTCRYNNVSQKFGFEARDASVLSRLALRATKVLTLSLCFVYHDRHGSKRFQLFHHTIHVGTSSRNHSAQTSRVVHHCSSAKPTSLGWRKFRECGVPSEVRS